MSIVWRFPARWRWRVAWSPKGKDDGDRFSPGKVLDCGQPTPEQDGLTTRLLGDIDYGKQIGEWSSKNISTNLQKQTLDIASQIDSPRNV
jgi:hypothetical protein